MSPTRCSLLMGLLVAGTCIIIQGSRGSLAHDQHQSDRCPICEKDFSYFRGFELACGHRFHYHCLTEWIEQFQALKPVTCPDCLSPFRSIHNETWREFRIARALELSGKLREMSGIMAMHYDDPLRIPQY